MGRQLVPGLELPKADLSEQKLEILLVFLLELSMVLPKVAMKVTLWVKKLDYQWELRKEKL